MPEAALRPRCPSITVVCAGAWLALASGGCVGGSLASSTGNRAGGEWSIAPRQQVHVGETVEFSFVLKQPLRAERLGAAGRADYCIFEIGDERYDVDRDEYGGFRTAHTFDQAAAGDIVTVRATAYRQNEQRDHMRIAGEWVENKSPYDKKDTRVAGGAIHLKVYQATLRVHVSPSADTLDFSTGQLTLRRYDQGITTVFQQRPLRRGFGVERHSGGGWWVVYHPVGNEINAYGVTPYEFSVYDFGGNRHVYSGELETP